MGDRGVTFVNAGVSGHSTIEEAARLDGLLDALNPVAVVLVFVPNDAIPWNETAQRRTDLLSVEERQGSRLLELAGSFSASAGVEEWYHSFYRGVKSADWDRARRALLAMSELCRARRVRFGVVHFPLMHRLDAYPFTDIEECVASAAREAEIPYLDLTPSFAGQDARTFWVHPVDRHPNAKAHAIAAHALRPFVEELVK
jgi:lysophospholipase L1-like esterase